MGKTPPIPGSTAAQKIKLVEKRVSQDARLAGTIYAESLQFRPELHQNVWAQPAHVCEKGDVLDDRTPGADRMTEGSDGVQLWDYFAGDFMLMSKESWEKVGGFIEIPYMPS